MTDAPRLLIDHLDTPIGELAIVADDGGNLRAADWTPTDGDTRLRRYFERRYGIHGLQLEPAGDPNGLTSALRSYFAGDFKAIDALPVNAAGSPFQCEVWRALREIPCGTTISYARLARQIGRPTAVRAVGLANGSNPVPIVVPCHRVIGSDGSLTGYGGGIDRKRWLLEHEKQSCLFRLLP
jgi:methylated-DNA-[protein]-cysteine S-methyltransferase